MTLLLIVKKQQILFSNVIIIIIIIIIFLIPSTFYAYMGWAVSCKRLTSISVFSQVHADFPFFQVNEWQSEVTDPKLSQKSKHKIVPNNLDSEPNKSKSMKITPIYLLIGNKKGKKHFVVLYYRKKMFQHIQLILTRKKLVMTIIKSNSSKTMQTWPITESGTIPKPH